MKEKRKNRKGSLAWLILFCMLMMSHVACANQLTDVMQESVGTQEIETDTTDSLTEQTVVETEEVEETSQVELVEESTPKSDRMESTLEIHFIDVGQGDATLFICDDHALLLDAGDTTQGTAVRNYLRKQGVDSLDYLVLTHPDADHIGGAASVITNVDIDTVLMTDYEKSNKVYEQLMQALSYRSMQATIPKVSSEYTLGEATFTILGPMKTYDNSNDSSLVLLFTHGEEKFLFTGDAEEQAEQDLCDAYEDLSADVYQAGHHGSKTASSEAMLQKVNPEYCVISCGEGNSYGHPHAQTLNTLRSMGVSVFRTDEQGSLIVTSDGSSLTWNASPTETWKAGEPTGNSQGIDQEKPAIAQEKLPVDAKVSEESGPAVDTQETAQVESEVVVSEEAETTEISYVLNTKSHKFHRLSCGSLPTTNRQDTDMTRDEVIAAGYEPCKKCNP